MKSVIFRTKPDLTNESLLGYLHRCARKNFYADLSWLLDSLNVSWKTKERTLREVASGQFPLDDVEGLCGAPPGSLSTLAYVSVQGSADLCQFGQKVVRSDSLMPLRRRECPICAAEDAAHHRLLDIPFYVACHLHECWLVGDCPNESCGRSFKHTQLIDAECPGCGTSLQHTAAKADSTAVELARELARLDAGAEPPDDAPYQSLGELLTGLESAAIIDLPESMLGRFQLSLHLRSDAELRQMANQAWRWIRSTKSFREQATRHVWPRRAALPNAPRALWETHIDRAIRAAPACSVMRQMDRWRSEFDDMPSKQHVSPAMADDFQTIKSAAAALGVPQMAIRQMMKAGMLGSNTPIASDTVPEKTFPSVAIEDFFRRLRQQSDPTFPSWSTDAISFGAAWNTPGHAVGGRIRFMALLEGVLDGRCRSHLPVGANLSEMLLSIDDLQAGAEANSQSLLPLRDAARALGMTQRVLSDLVADGFIESVKAQHQWQWRCMIPSTEIRRFHEQFVIGAAVAKRRGLDPIEFIAQVLDAGIVPVRGPSPKRDLPHIFIKRHMRERVVTALLRGHPKPPEHRSRSRKHGPTGRLLSTKEVAERLDVSEKALSAMWQQGFIARHVDKRHGGGAIRFTTSAVEAYERQFSRNPEFMRATDAADHIGVTFDAFERHYVKAGRIELIGDGAERMYVRKSALEQFHPSRDEFMTLGQACEVLGISSERFYNLARSGRMPHAATSTTGQFLYDRQAICAFGKKLVSQRRGASRSSA